MYLYVVVKVINRIKFLLIRRIIIRIFELVFFKFLILLNLRILMFINIYEIIVYVEVFIVFYFCCLFFFVY